MQLNTILKTVRPPFLVLTPICVFLGLSTSLAIESQVDLNTFFLILIAAVFAHISANTLNEYYDFKSGLDLKTQKTGFSGGSGALPASPEMAQITLAVGLASLLVTIVIGIYLIHGHGFHILPFGLVGVLLIVTYTQWINRYPFLCLFAPGTGFGILIVVGTHVTLTGEHSVLPWIVSLVPFFLINNVLLLNQYPDINADLSVGRNTFPIAFGLTKSNYVYALFFLAAYSLILIIAVMDYVPVLSIIALIPMVFSMFALLGAIKYASKIGDFPRHLGANVAAAVFTPLLLGISIVNG